MAEVSSSVDERPVSLRQQLAMERMKDGFKEIKADENKESGGTEEKAAGKLKTKLLGLIPGYGIYIAFKKALGMGKEKIGLLDIFIFVFSNLSSIFYLLIFIAALIPIFILLGLVSGLLSAIQLPPELIVGP